MSATAQTLRPPSKTLMLLEGRAVHEFGAFLGALPLLSLAPKGDGHPVLVLPGLVASDSSTRPLRSFLKARGYAVSGWRQGRNFGLREGVQDSMVDLVRELNQAHGRKVSLVGWSLGGVYARQLAKMMPDRVRSVITLGSPFAAHPKATNAWRVYEMASGQRADQVDPGFGGSLADTPPVPTTAIYSRRHLRLAGLHGKILRDLREHRGGKQPLRHGPSSCRGLRGRRPPRPARRSMGPLRPLRMAQRGVSESE
jgi:pimeloyl-ACP methyl ester carboxylesterase